MNGQGLEHALMGRRYSRRRAYILLVVLGITAVATTMGYAFISAQGTAVPEAQNRLCMLRAMNLAESGIATGSHFLLYPPTTVAWGDYWRGSNGVIIDSTTDYMDISVAKSATDPNQYTITSVGVARRPDNSVGSRYTVVSKVLLPPDGKWRVPYAVVGPQLQPDGRVEIYGNVHANGNVAGMGAWCQGNITAVGTATWTTNGPPASIVSGTATYSGPAVSTAPYLSYTIRGRTYSAYQHNSTTMTSVQVSTLNALNWSTTNPGRIIYVPNSLTLSSGTALSGTLVVVGELKISGNNTRVTARPDYPAIIASDGIGFEAASTSLTVDGSVLCRRIDGKGQSLAVLDITGACILSDTDGVRGTSAGLVFRFRWDSMRSVFYNLAEASQLMPYTLLTWSEN